MKRIQLLLLSLTILPLLATGFRIAAFAREDGEVRVAIWDCVVDQLKALAVFGVFGPPLGLLPFLLITFIVDGKLQNVWVIFPLLLLSYPFGGIPAMATAAVIGALRPWLWGWRALAAGCATGALIPFLCVLVIDDTFKLSEAGIMTGAGAFAGLVCARIWFRSPKLSRPLNG